MTKKECRTHFMKLRQGLSTQELQIASRKICAHFIQHFATRGKTISIFLPITTKQEIDTYQLINQQEALECRFVLPVADFTNNSMQHLLYEGSHQIEISSHGIPEPLFGTEIPPSEIDIIIVPMLCFDTKGYRVGYGKGFYDRFLMQLPKSTKIVGFCHFDAISSIEDINNFDIALPYIITPNGLTTL